MHVVIVGGGFGGVRTARLLARDARIRITLISDESHFVHYDAVATLLSGQDASRSMMSLGHIFAEFPNVTLVKDTIITIDPERKVVKGRHKYSYDELVIAIGSVANYGGIRGTGGHAYGISNLDELDRFKNRIEEEVRADLLRDRNYIVVGAGATGVEVAGSLNQHLRSIIRLHKVRNTAATVILIEASPTILPHFGSTAQKKARARLNKSGIKVIVHERVDRLSNDDVMIDGNRVPTHSVLWTVGTTTHPFFIRNKAAFTFTDRGHIIVDNRLQGAPHIFIIGDSASNWSANLATSAVSQAAFMSRLLQAKAHKRRLPTYRPVKYPSFVTIDPTWSYIERFGIYIVGSFGAACKRLLDLQLLAETIGWKNARLLQSGKNHKHDN